MFPEPGASGGWSEPCVASPGEGVIVASRARRSLRRIFPAADFGIASTNSTARTFLYGATRSATNAATSAAVRSAPGRGTTKALGTSSPSASRTPMTAASAIRSWASSTASSSAGAT